MSRRNCPFVVILVLLVTFDMVFANVSMRNGNFFMGYTDVIFFGGFEPKMERVYNSKTSFKGIYGWGWGTEYEAYLKVTSDGLIVVHEYGGGADNVFEPAGKDGASISEKLMLEAVDLLARASEDDREVSSAATAAAYRQRLLSDRTFRHERWETALASGQVRSRDVPVGTFLQSRQFTEQFITRERDGYTRKSANGRIEEFNLNGRLVRIMDRDNNFIRLRYSAGGTLESLVDNRGRSMTFTFNERQLLTRIETYDGPGAEFRYNTSDELIYSRDIDNNVYEFAYSTDGRHNLTSIGYSDGTMMKMEYYGRDKHESIKSVKDRDGMITEYSYEFFEGKETHYRVGVKAINSRGKTASDSSYEYFLRNTATGGEWLWKMISVVDGIRTETEYEPGTGVPKHTTSDKVRAASGTSRSR